MKNDWFEKICHALPISPERRIWSDGEQIYCKDEAAAETVAELIECLYMMMVNVCKRIQDITIRQKISVTEK